MLDLTQNYFQLFGLEPGFDIDEPRLAARYRELQAVCHPDRHAVAEEGQRLQAVQAAAFVNEAFTTLRQPLSRARYLLELAGVALDDEQDTQMDPAFLMEQMELREALAEARFAEDPFVELDKVGARLRELDAQQLQAFRQDYAARDLGAATADLRKLQFLHKLGQQLAELEEQLDNDA